MSPILPVPGARRPASTMDTGEVQGDGIQFGNWRGDADRPEPDPPVFLPPEQRVGFAIMGLGRLSLGQILPAFAACKYARLVALISNHREKAATVAAQYGIAPHSVYNEETLADIANNPAIQVVYVVTPNGLHAAHVAAIARTGKHVLCEKPMANTSLEAHGMIDACAIAGVKLMIAYRCQFEPYNRAVIDMLVQEHYGRARLIEAANTQMQGPADQWRFRPEMAGGGALPDIGLYCLNGARGLLREDPEEVYAQIVSPKGDARYNVLDETVSFMLRFPSGVVANCAASYGAHESKTMRVFTERGLITLENAFAYHGQRLYVAYREGNNEVVKEFRLGVENQFALEIDHFADCVRYSREPRTPGALGLRDHEIMEAIYRSARDGRAVSLNWNTRSLDALNVASERS